MARNVGMRQRVANNSLEDTEQFVSALYRAILRREPDCCGLRFYVSALQAGRSPVSIIEDFVSSNEFKTQNAVKLFVPPGHFSSPIVNPIEADQHFRKLVVPSALPGIKLSRDEMISTWHSLLPFLRSNPFPETKGHKFRYAFDNPAYSWGDGSTLHAMIRQHRPQRIIEIGSGWSSACMADTVEHYLDGACLLTFVEPYPALVQELLGNFLGQVQYFKKPVQDISLDVFRELEANDIVFIDSTHVLRTGSDVCFELFQILPCLRTGVLVHIHDMFWPFEYPRVWAVDENRSWNELYAVRAFLTNNADWRIVLFNDYLANFERPMLEATYPRFLRNSGGALWLEHS
jgi:predicted O-methyltransferase YrrM